MQHVGGRAAALVIAVLVMAVLATACASTATVDSISEAANDTVRAPAAVDETAPSAEETPPLATATTTTPAPAASESPSSSQAPVGELVNLVGGGQLDLNSIEGTDTVLWFWAPW